MGCKPGFPRGTTPPLTFTVSGYDLTGWDVYLTFKPHGADEITKTGGQLVVEYDLDSDTSTVSVTLTQTDTLAMTVGLCEVNLRAARDNGAEAIATDVASVNVGRILHDGVIPEVPDDQNPA